MGSSVRAGGDVTEAPPPCEHDCDCDMYHDGECFHCDSEQKDAEIAELRAAIQDYIDSPVHGDHKGIYNPDDCCAPSARVRAALASSEVGKP